MSDQIRKAIERVVERLEQVADTVRRGRENGRLVPQPVPVRSGRPIPNRTYS
ncbi:MAG: hypothetical protein R3A46_11905 [Thermomicrobiales bacterium]